MSQSAAPSLKMDFVAPVMFVPVRVHRKESSTGEGVQVRAFARDEELTVVGLDTDDVGEEDIGCETLSR